MKLNPTENRTGELLQFILFCKMPTKKCFIPRCGNTTNNTNKVFFTVPMNLVTRKLWYEAARISLPFYPKSLWHCCEDHFDVEDDFENWMYFKTMGSKLIIKHGVVPHKFIDNSPLETLSKNLTNSAKKRKLENIKNFEAQKYSKISNKLSTSKVVRNLFSIPQNVEECTLMPCASGVISVSPEMDSLLPSTRSVGIQTNLKKSVRSVQTNTTKINVVDVRTSPMRIKKKIVANFQEKQKQLSSSQSTGSNNGGSVYVPSTDSDELGFKFQRTERRKTTITALQKNPKLYLGISEELLGILNTISIRSKIDYVKILITLKKIRLNDTYARLAADFDRSSSEIQRIFVNTVPKLASFFQNFIFWPEKFKNKVLLPIPFRSRYAKVESIIDCFEIEIEKPSDPVKQATTWSSYKQCNTVKFLISSTPNGFINFISNGFPGRISDKDIVAHSLYLKELPNGAYVLADRGFKHINAMLAQKHCILLRPPSVSSDQKSSKEEVKLSKTIAALRIHIERVIRRVREYYFLKPHACVNHKLIYLLNSIVIIVCGLINLQDPLIAL